MITVFGLVTSSKMQGKADRTSSGLFCVHLGTHLALQMRTLHCLVYILFNSAKSVGPAFPRVWVLFNIETNFVSWVSCKTHATMYSDPFWLPLFMDTVYVQCFVERSRKLDQGIY